MQVEAFLRYTDRDPDALLGVAALLNPACLAGPYGGLDARMKTIFLGRINEAHPVWEFFRLSPSQTFGGYGYAAFALAVWLACAYVVFRWVNLAA